MAYKQKGCTPITAKIQKTTKGGVTNPLLKAMGVPMKKNPSVAKQTSMGPVPLPKESNSVVQNISYYSSDAGKAYAKSSRERQLKKRKEDRDKKYPTSQKQKEFAKKKHQGKYYKEPAKTNITKKADIKGKGAGSVTAANNPGKSSSGKITGKIGSDLRKAQYDKKGWKYDDTIKGYDKSGNKIKARTAKPKVKAVSNIEASKPKVEKTAEIKMPAKAKTKKEVRVENRTNRQTARKENRANRKATREENRANRKAARKGSPAKQTMQQQNRIDRKERREAVRARRVTPKKGNAKMAKKAKVYGE
jgi:hypothetical protein